MKFPSKYHFLFLLFFGANNALAQNASIESVDPKIGYAGQLVDIKGNGLAGFDRVFFGSMEGTIITSSEQLIEAKVPTGATFDNVTIFKSSTRLHYSGERFMLSYGGEQGIDGSDFDAQIDVFAQIGLNDVTVSDLDGDGKNDIIGANQNSNLATILRNQSTPGSIGLVQTNLNIGLPGLNTTAGDLNGDGKAEVVFSEADDGERLLILVNNCTPGNLSFTTQTISLTGVSTKRIVIRDLDLDGKPDLVVSDQSSNRILIVKNTSSGGALSFSNDILELTLEGAESTDGLDVEDLNGDGKPEIITSQFNNDGGGFYIATNQSTPGNFSFDNFNQFNTPGTLLNLKVGDFNQDNKPDIVATLFLSSAIAVFINETTTGEEPQFASAQNLPTDLRPWSLDFGDLDGDGQKDIVVATVGADKTVNVLNNNGTAGLDFTKVDIPVTFINRNIRVADFDGDSKPDIIFTSVDDDANGIPASNISILRNNRCIIPVITPEGPINACEGNPVVLRTQEIEGLTYEWRQDGTLVTGANDNFIELTTAAASGVYTVTIISEGGNCSEVSEEVDVTIVSAGSLPSASISSNDPVCTGGTLNLNSTDVGATKYEWRGPENFTAVGISAEVVNFNTNKAGRYFLDVFLGSCIIETKSIVVEAISSPNFSLAQSGEGIYCEGEGVTLQLNPASAGFSYQWYEGVTPISGATAAVFSPSGSGDFYVEITDLANPFCPQIYSDTLEVVFLEAAQVDFSLPTSACSATPVSFTDQSIVADASLARYNWDFGDGSVSTEQNPTHTYNSAGTYQVTLEVSYDGFASCSSQFSQQLTINGGINASITSSATAICQGEGITLSIDESFESYQWSTGEQTASITVNQGGNYSVTLTSEDGCVGVSQISVQEFPTPEVTLTASSTTIVSGDSVTIAASGLVDFQWTADSTQLSFTDDQITIAPDATTTITVEGVDQNGCFGIAEITIRVEEDNNFGDQFVPMKFFSPNNDAIAQFWKVENIEDFTQCGVEIYDQQGNMIYEAKPYNNDWEGTSNGSPVPDGVYYFVIKCEGSGIARSGSITLLR
jgi:gliding motility-associated-like protein